MKILLVGEYSRLHNSLKEGLQALGHEVTLVSTGDGFKKYPADMLLTPTHTTGWAKKWKVLFYKLFGFNLSSISVMRQFFLQQERLKGFDVVQFINESPLGMMPKHEKEIISFLKKHNKKLFLLSCGTDYISVKDSLEERPRYSILSPLLDGKASKESYAPVLKYMRPEFKELHHFMYAHIEGVIASDLDYHLPLVGHQKYLGLIPNPINLSTLEYHLPDLSEKIVIFHGINRPNYYRKGSDYFETALEKIEQNYPDRVEIITVESLPYAEYIQKYNQAHIVLDQVLAYDQGYNALEAMAKGKVVFTGAEEEFVSHYQLQQPVAINALPDSDAIFNELEQLILHPERIVDISKNARKFIEEVHDYQKVATQYLDCWNNT